MARYSLVNLGFWFIESQKWKLLFETFFLQNWDLRSKFLPIDLLFTHHQLSANQESLKLVLRKISFIFFARREVEMISTFLFDSATDTQSSILSWLRKAQC